MLPEFVDNSFKNKWIDSLEEEIYHADTTAINASALKSFQKSPEHYYSEFILKEKKEKDSPSLSFGRATHLALLQPDKFMGSYIVMPNFGDQRVSANKQRKIDWLSSHKSTKHLTSEEYEKLLRMIESFQKNKYAVSLLKDACFEVTGYFRDPETNLKCRIRPDILRTDLTAMPDLKTTIDASPTSFQRQCFDYKYYIQMAFYSLGVEQITGKKPDMPCFIAIEKEAPYSTVVYAIDEGMMSYGEETVRTLLNKFSECIKNNSFPSYFSDGIGSIGLPPWVYTNWNYQL